MSMEQRAHRPKGQTGSSSTTADAVTHTLVGRTVMGAVEAAQAATISSKRAIRTFGPPTVLVLSAFIASCGEGSASTVTKPTALPSPTSSISTLDQFREAARNATVQQLPQPNQYGFSPLSLGPNKVAILVSPGGLQDTDSDIDVFGPGSPDNSVFAGGQFSAGAFAPATELVANLSSTEQPFEVSASPDTRLIIVDGASVVVANAQQVANDFAVQSGAEAVVADDTNGTLRRDAVADRAPVATPTAAPVNPGPEGGASPTPARTEPTPTASPVVPPQG